METAAGGFYDGGAGGKFRRRPARRAATPYDRPPPALRNPDGRGTNGWLSKLVDPASRIIADGASKLFQSVFRKRLLPLPESAREARQELPRPVLEKNSSRQQEDGNKNVKDPNDDKLVCDGINEFEQLLKHKTFTRDEFNRLTELLRSRTVDLVTTTEKSRSEDEKKRTEPSTSQNLPNHVEWERQDVSAPENGLGTSGLLGRISTADGGLNALQEVASPTEVAKEFMGSRTLRVSPTTLGLRSQALREDPNFLNTVPFKTPRSFNMPFTPRSSRLLPDNGYVTPRPRGRSAIYNMARSPYMNVHSASALKGPAVTEDYRGGSSAASPWTSNLLSGGKQALKRRSSVLDTDFGSVGPIRRIRQKSNLTTPSKSASSPQRTLIGPATDAQKLAGLDGPSNLQSTENGHGRTDYNAVPTQSSEMARKILQQLDKLVPSPKEKSSEQKLALAREKSPSKLTTDMLSRQALKSMEALDSPKFQLTQGSSDNHSSGMDSIDPRNDFSEKGGIVEENGPSKISFLGAKNVSGIVVAETVATSAKDAASSSKVTPATMLRSDPGQSQSKHAFHMSAPEDSLDMDEDNISIKEATTNTLANEKEKLQAAQAKFKVVATETGDTYFTSGKNASTLVSQDLEKKEKAFDVHHSVAAKDGGFAFPTVSSTPTGHPSSVNPNKQSVQKDQQNGHPAFECGPKSFNKEPSVRFHLPVTVPKSGATSDSKSEALDSKPMAAGSQGSVSDKIEETQKASKLFSLPENGSSSALSSMAVQPVFAFGPYASSTQSNGVLSSFTSAASVAATSTVPVFGSMSAYTTASASSPSVGASSSIFNFVSGSSASLSPNVISNAVVTSGVEVTDSVAKNKPASTLSESSTTTSPSAVVVTTALPFGASTMTNAMTATSSSSIQTQSFGAFGNSTSGSLLATEGASISQCLVSQLGSSSASAPSFGLNASSTFSTTGSIIGSSNSAAKPFVSVAGTEIKAPVSVASGSSPSFTSVSSSTSLFGPSAQPSSSATANTAVGKFGQPSNSITANFFSSSSGSASSAPSIFGSSSQATNSGSTFAFSSQATNSGSIFASSPQLTSLPAGINNGLSSQPASATGSIFGSNSQLASSSPSMFGALSQPATSTSNLFGSSTQPANSTSTRFGLSSQPATSPTTGIFGVSSQPSSSVFTFSSSSTSQLTGSPFGSSTSGSGPLTFNSSSPTLGSSSLPPTFTFHASTSGATANLFSSVRPMFQMSNAAVSFGVSSPSNDQMNVEDSMAEDTVQASTGQAALSFSQPATSPSPFPFGSTPVQSGGQQVFHFVGQAAPQNPSSPFAAVTGSLDVAPGGSFSLGTAGIDKSNRKIFRARRDKQRKK